MKVLFGADVSIGYLSQHRGEIRDPAVVFGDALPLFRAADFSVLNMENVFGDEAALTPIIKSGPNLLATKDLESYLTAIGPTALNFANNHAGDYGDEALLSTMADFESAGILTFGAGKNITQAYRPVLFRKDGLTVAVIGVCENEFGIATDEKVGAAGYRLGLVTKAIRAALDAGCIPVIYFHGGNEHNPLPSPMKNDLYRHFIDLGAKAVIAMHTHCPQGYEYYGDGLIVYSMGNFYFPDEPGEMTPNWTTGYLSEVEFTADKVSLAVHPYVYSNAELKLLRDNEKTHFLAYLDALNAIIADPAQIRAYFDTWCVMDGIHGYAHNAVYRDEMCEEGAETVRHIKNLLVCEAHNELMQASFSMIYNGTIAEAQTRVDYMRKLQSLNF